MKKILITLIGFSSILLAACDSKISENTSSVTSSETVSTSNGSSSESSSSESKLIINTPSKTKLGVGDTLKLSVRNADVEASKLKWSTSDESVALVNSKGLVHAVSKGTALITVSDGVVTSDPVSINVDVTPVSSISISNTPSTISVGQTITLETSILPSEANQGVEITSSDVAIEVNSTNKTLKAIKYTDKEVTIKVFASKDFSKVSEFKLRVNPLDSTKKVKISFDTGNYTSKEAIDVVKGSTIDNLSYDPFSNVEDKNTVSDIVFFGFYYDKDFINPVTFPMTSTYSDMTLYAKFDNLSSDGSHIYEWNYDENEDGTYNVASLSVYNNNLSNLSVGIPAYHNGKKVTTFNKIGVDSFVNKITNFALPNTITSLPENGIQNWGSLEYLYIPSDTKITEIPKYGISSLTKLKSLYIPDNVTKINDYGLTGNKSLTNLHLSNNLETVGIYSLAELSSLEELNFTSVKTIGQQAFQYMEKLKYVYFPSNLEKLSTVFPFMNSTKNIVRFVVDSNNQYYSNDDFGSLYNKDKSILYVYANGKGGTNAYIPNTVKTIFDRAFAESTIEVVKIPSSVTTLELSPFYNMPNLKAAYVPTSVTTIKNNAFSLCNSDKLVVYTNYQKDQLPEKWSSLWNYNSNNDQMESVEFNTIYGFDADRFNF